MGEELFLVTFLLAAQLSYASRNIYLCGNGKNNKII